MKDYYRLLEVDPEASQEVLTNAYRALVKKHHPDRYHTTELRKKNDALLQDINEAYRILSAAETRTHYDRRFKKFQSSKPQQEKTTRGLQEAKRLGYWICLAMFVFLVMRTAGRILLMMGPLKWLVIGAFVYLAVRLWRSTKSA